MDKKLEEAIEVLNNLKIQMEKAFKRNYINNTKEREAIETVSNYIENSISKETIEKKIAEYNNVLKSCNKSSDINRIKGINERILELKELLKEKIA